jgi:flagellar motor switch protein FliM
MDPRLLARMTGRLGDRKTIETISREIGDAAAATLCERLAQAVSVKAKIGSVEVSAGTRAEESARYDESCALCEVTIVGWAEDVLLSCQNSLVIASTEHLLGGEGAAEENMKRPLSQIERDVAGVILGALGEALRAAVKPTSISPDCGAVFTGPLKRETDLDENDHTATASITVEIGGRSYRLDAVMPQQAVLKTSVARPQEPTGPAARPQWVEQLTQKVHTSNVTLQANVFLAPVTLAATSRLKPGDVLPFRDEKDVRVLLKANGKNLFWCELGRAGNRYMLRLQERHGSEEDFMRQFTA